MMCRLVFFSLLEWKPLVKMKMVFSLSLGIKVWDTLFYLPGESNAGASCFCSVATLEFMGGGSVVTLVDAWTSTWLKKEFGARHTVGARHGL